MGQGECAHVWEMVNVTPGFIVTEKCHKCAKVSNYFSTEKRPPLDEYRDGEHFWSVADTAQSFRFDLRCTLCGTVVAFDHLLGVMMCTGCDAECEVAGLLAQLLPKRTSIYVAFGYLPVAERKQLTLPQIEILESYYNQRRKSASRIKIVSHEKVRDVLTCYPQVIHDAEMLSLTRPGKPETPAHGAGPGGAR